MHLTITPAQYKKLNEMGHNPKPKTYNPKPQTAN
eukprot:COSAG03_NODE_21219_length_307_cov_0.812500_1_plen_33_part_10